MSVVSRIRGFLSRHRNKFILGGVLITGSLVLSKYAKQKLREWQEKETVEFLERSRKQNHFESINRTCNKAILNLSSALIEVVNETVNTEEIVEQLKNNSVNKLEKWNDLKVLVFTKAGVMIYSLVLLVVTLKVQMNIIGGYLYKDPNSVSTEMQEKYLSLCQDLLNNGVKKMCKEIEGEVIKILEMVDLKKQLKLSDLEAIFWTMQSKINLRLYTFKDDVCNANDDIYNSMLRDTVDLLDSDEVISLITHCVHRGFLRLGDQLAEFFAENNSKITELPNNGDFRNPFDNKKPMAKLIPILNGLLSKHALPQNLLQLLIVDDKLQCLSANIYESFV